MDGFFDVTGGAGSRPNVRLRHKPFLHFHVDAASGCIDADVELGGGPSAAVEPVWASTGAEREALLRRVHAHVRHVSRR